MPETDAPGLGFRPPLFETIGTGEAGIAYLVEVEAGTTFEIVYSPDGTEFERQSLPEGVSEMPENYPMGIWGPLGVVVGANHVLYLADQSDGVQLWIGTPRATAGS